MKESVLIVVFAAISLSVSGEEPFRTWTQEETKKTIEARITDKKLDDSEAKVRLKSGKIVWLKSATLIAEDQDYIKKWVKPIKHLTVRMKGSKKGQKKLEVTAVAGPEILKVSGSLYGYPKTYSRTLKPGETITFEYWGPTEYWVRAYVKGKKVDEETDKTKTGL